MEYLLHLLVLVGLYTMLAQSLSVTSGLTKLISLTHAGFFGIGAYTSAILSLKYGLPLGLNILLGIVLAIATAAIFAKFLTRTTDDYFVICTLGTQAILFSVFDNWISLTRGPLGLSRIPSFDIGLFPGSKELFYFGVSWSVMGILWLFLRNFKKSGLGLILTAISTDEIFVQSLGKDVLHAKTVSFALGAGIAAMSGGLYSAYVGYIDPSSFTLDLSIYVLSIAIIGGLGNLTGSLVASLCLVAFPEILRYLGISISVAANLRQIIYGLAIVGIMLLTRTQASNPAAPLPEKVDVP